MDLIAPGRHLTADVWRHPLTAEGRETVPVVVPAGATLADVVREAVPAARPGSIAVALDGRVIAAADWSSTPVAQGQVVTLRPVLAGDDTDPLRVILLLVVLVASIYAPVALGMVTASGTLTTSGMLLSAAITLGGTLIVNAIAPPRLAGQPEPPEPVYALTGGANRARPYQPLLLVLGEHRVFPDLGAVEYTEFSGDDQYLYQIFHWGLGNLDITELRVGDSLLDSFDEVETDWADSNGDIDLVAGNVDTTTGAALEDTDWVERTTAEDTSRIGIDLVGLLFATSKKGEIQRHTVPLEIEYWPEGDSSNKTTKSVTTEHAETTPYRKTLSYELATAGTYVVRVKRTTTPSDSSRVQDDITWAALRSYQPDTADYTGQTRLGIRIRATGQLSGRLDRLSGIVKQKIPVWNPAANSGAGAWTSPQTDSNNNPAWVFRSYAKGVEVSGRLVAGVGLPESRIDDASIKAWGAWCAEQGLTCNLVLDRALSHAEVLTIIGLCGRASPSWQTGKLGVVWDEADRAATALFTPGNIVAGSFGVDYVAGKAAEEIACRYIDPDLDWQWNTVRRTVPGVTTPGGTATLTLTGVTDPDQAAAECNLQAARQVYHRRRIRWEAGAEGLAVARGDVVHLTHSLIDGGTAGRVLSGTTTELTLNRAVTLSGGDDYLLLRLPDGTLHTTTVSHPDGAGTEGETDLVVLGTALPHPPGAVELTYHDADSTGGAANTGAYAWLANAADNTSGVFRWDQILTAAALLINKLDADGDSHSDFYATVRVGDSVELRYGTSWAVFEVIDILAAPTDRQKFGVRRTAASHEGTTPTLPWTPGTDVTLSWTTDESPLDTLWRFYAADSPPARVRIVALEPTADQRVRIEAIDEVDAYYDAAISDLDVPLPLPQPRAVSVLHIAITETLIRAGQGFSVQLTATLTVSGPWRGGIIRASLDGGPTRTVARLVDGETSASWFTPPAGTLTITAVPGTEAASSGTPLSVNYIIRGPQLPPANVTNFLVEVLGDGTRRFRWTALDEVDIAGYRIRYTATTAGSTPSWSAMAPLHNGLLTASPYETNEPQAGNWTFAIRAEDTSGNLSTAANYIIAELSDPRTGNAFLWDCPSAARWPGTIWQATRSNDGLDALEGRGAYTWANLTTWSAWTSWALGDGNDSVTAMSYTTEAIDLGVVLPFSLAWSADTTGTVTFQYRTATTAGGLANATWTTYTANTVITTRHLQLRWRLTGDGSTLLRLDHLCFQILGTGATEKFLDVNTNTWTGSAAAGRTIPTTLSTVTGIDVTLQNVGAGWSWTLLNKTGPSIKIFNGAGAGADAVVDVIVRGVR